MKEFVTLLTGSAMLAGCCVASWVIGGLMGFAAARLSAGAGGKHADVEQLLARQRADALKGRPTAPAAAPGA